jgi:hypothetical protein
MLNRQRTLALAYHARPVQGEAVVPLDRPRVAAPAAMPASSSAQAMAAIAPRFSRDEAPAPWTVLGTDAAVAPPSDKPLAVAVAQVRAVASDSAPSVPALPMPPPLPFKVIGRAQDDAGPIAFLVHGDDNLVVRPGDRIGQAYRLERIDAQALTFTYLPLDSAQTLSMDGPP